MMGMTEMMMQPKSRLCSRTAIDWILGISFLYKNIGLGLGESVCLNFPLRVVYRRY
jgi:hypothetical protein